MATPSQFQSFWNGVILVSRCPICESVFEPEEARVLSEDEGNHLLYLRCRSCSHAVLAHVAVSKEGVSSVGMLTDCSADDALRFRGETALVTDDVIDTHLELEDSDRFIRILRG